MNSIQPISTIYADGSIDEKPHAIVIGSGFGGLAAAIRLGARGYRVTVLEKLDAPGGRAYVFHENGYTFDAGPTIITAPFVLEDLWSLCGRKLEDDVDLRPMDPFFRIRFDDGTHFDYSGDRDAILSQIDDLCPADKAGYLAYLQASEERYRVGFEQLGTKSFDSLAKLVKFLPQMIRLRGDKSVYKLVSKFVSNEKLRMVMSFHPLLIGGNPFSVTCIYSLISYLEQRWGVYSAMGGTGSIVTGLADLIESQGSQFRFNAEVDEILIDDGKAVGVRLQSGDTLKADVVVSNADSAWTYRHLIKSEHRKRWTNQKLEKAHYSNGLFVWYFGTRKTYPDVPHHSVLLGPRYRDLLKDIFKHKKLADDFSLYLHRPTATDPDMAPEGCDTFYALVPVPHLDAGIDWKNHAETFRLAIQKRLEETVLPDLGEHIDASLLMTPLDFQDRLCSYKGAGFSFEPRISQSAWFRPNNRSEDIEGLYLVGAGTHPGAGIPGVISSAQVLDEVVPHGNSVRA
ncbi:phytoene dehydrogenase [Luminiphilus syltensis NOR5-1B]|uniref:Phytoene dehydrogenase n=1 Tax=Luminiphilus syltensis NOR5-1B TaxID=565045 RepID=B8KT16_9GAMM|nr:phytoene desaturase [Luminiphilus syltensis]EED35144.1 phytoene dehydrogenase [Luminiphilus syltensis NOR5-1B]